MKKVKIFALTKHGAVGIYDAIPCGKSPHAVFMRVDGRPLRDWLTFLAEKYVSIDVLLSDGELRNFPIERKMSCSMATQEWVAHVINFIRSNEND